MKNIGPSFCDELAAHGGLVGQHFTWQDDGTIIFFADTPQDVIDGVNSVYAAHDPSKPSIAELTAQRNALMSAANAATSGMSDAFTAELLDAADALTFKAWAAYKLALGKIDLTQQPVAWPTQPTT